MNNKPKTGKQWRGTKVILNETLVTQEGSIFMKGECLTVNRKFPGGTYELIRANDRIRIKNEQCFHEILVDQLG